MGNFLAVVSSSNYCAGFLYSTYICTLTGKGWHNLIYGYMVMSTIDNCFV